MATDVIALSATVPAGTVFPHPAIISLNVGTNLINKIRWRVPPGPRGNLSWYLAMGGVQVLPQSGGGPIIADDEWDEWEIEDLPDSGAWQLIGFNTGTFPHTVYLGFYVTPVVVGGTGNGGGNTLTGFPAVEADIATMWLDGGGQILA
jgi:hypothetical protein